jgi:hypothetical protein
MRLRGCRKDVHSPGFYRNRNKVSLSLKGFVEILQSTVLGQRLGYCFDVHRAYVAQDVDIVNVFCNKLIRVVKVSSI